MNMTREELIKWFRNPCPAQPCDCSACQAAAMLEQDATDLREQQAMLVTQAETIQRLQRELSDSAAIHTCGPGCRQTPRCAEVADLRAALEEILAHDDQHKEICRAALAAKE